MPSVNNGPQNRMPPNGRQQGGPQQRRPSSSPTWWIILLGILAAWYIYALWPRSAPRSVEIPYTTFLSEVRQNNVAKVHIDGAAISGEFEKAVTWPPPKKAPEKTASSPKTSSAAPAKSAQKTGGQTPHNYSRFHTVFPQSVGDPSLMPLLESHHVPVTVAAPSSSWLPELLITWLPMILLFAFFWYIGSRMTQGQGGILSRLGRTKARRYSSEQPKITFNDVAGADEAKSELQEEVDFLKQPSKYHKLGAKIPKGVLLVGGPGTGKTLLARAVAGEAGVPFFSLNASEFVEMFVGVGASRVRDLFKQARETAPAIMFIDELDAVGRRRGAGLGAVNDEREQTLNQLLGELDGFDERHEVIVLAATNRPDVLDPALLRPGRFDRQVIVPLPDRTGREGILRIHTRNIALAPDVDFGMLARTTMGLSGAELANLANEAALAAGRHNRSAVTMADFEEAQDKVRLGSAQPQLVDPNERRVVAYHESGHAMVAWLTPEADPVRKVTIVPHGQALGLTEQIPGEERHNLSRSYLRARLAVMLGGRSAEEIVFGDITTGAENDLVEATRLARRMVTRWGMGKLGLVAFKTDEQQPFLGYEISQGREYSEATAARIDEEVHSLIEDTHQEVKRMLTEARQKLDTLVQTLLRDETIPLGELTRILGPRPEPDSSAIPITAATTDSAGS